MFPEIHLWCDTCQLSFVPIRKRSYWKVMFSQVSVCSGTSSSDQTPTHLSLLTRHTPCEQTDACENMTDACEKITFPTSLRYVVPKYLNFCYHFQSPLTHFSDNCHFINFTSILRKFTETEVSKQELFL